jgi:hypothetical protein
MEVHGGMGYASIDADSTLTRLDVPVAVGAFWTLPLPSGIKFQPWLSPRLHLRSTQPDGGESDSHLGFGGSFGLQTRFGRSLGLYAGGDVLSIEDASGDRSTDVELIGGFFYLLILNR